MSIRVGINGCGRIGRLLLRMAMFEQDVEIVAVNNRADARTLAHLLKYDSVHGRYAGNVQAVDGQLVVDGREIRVFAEQDPARIPWHALAVDLVVEATGYFTDEKTASRHLEAGAGRVLITAPARGNLPTVVMGVNDHILKPEHRIVSSASCTSNCLAPMAKVLHETFRIKKGTMTTIHAYTKDQKLVDGTHKDLRRARAAGFSIVPTTTGAASAIGQVIPELKGRLNGMAVRVPTPDGSLVDLVAQVGRSTSVEEVNRAFASAAANGLAGVLEYSEEPLVSADIIGNPYSCVFDAPSTMVVKKDMVKICGWYDNEWSYASRCLDLVRKFSEMRFQGKILSSPMPSVAAAGA